MLENLTQIIDEVDFGFSTFEDYHENITQNPALFDDYKSPELNVPYTLMEALVAITAVIGNGLVIIVFCRERRLRRRTNYYIISLALADLMVGMFGIPFAILVSWMFILITFRKKHLNFNV